MKFGKRNQRNTFLAQMISAAVVLGMMALTASEASADDAKVYAGAECRAYSGAVSIGNTGGVYNNSATLPAGVICPLIHDSVGSSLDNIVSAVVTVIDANNDSATQSVSCRLLAHLRNNGTWFFAASPLQSSINGDPATLNFGNLVTSDNHHYYLRCTIPPRDNNTNAASHIVSFSLVEQGG